MKVTSLKTVNDSSAQLDNLSSPNNDRNRQHSSLFKRLEKRSLGYLYLIARVVN